MGRVSGKAKEPGSRGSQYAKSVIFYAGKSHLMRPAGLRNIGRSCHFDQLIERVSREEPRCMRQSLQKGLKACAEGELESAEEKKLRKRATEDMIEKCNKRHKRSVIRKVSLLAPFGSDDEGEGAGAGAGDDEEEKNEPFDNENGSEDGDNDEEGPGDGSAPTEDDTTPSKHERQLALVRGEPLRIDDDECRINLARLHANRPFDINAEFESVLGLAMKLDPEQVKEDLVTYCNNRIETASMIKPPPVSISSSPEEIVDVLHILGRISEDALIRRAAAQMMLYLAVGRRLSTGGHHTDFLRKLAATKARNVSDKESKKIFKSYEKDYNQGKRWVDMVDTFGGSGIVMIFVISEIGSDLLTRKMTKYQRDCLVHISSHLYSITKLVKALGPDALGDYCKHGYLSQDTVEDIDTMDVLAE